jgi:predicted HTH domain antitoxin
MRDRLNDLPSYNPNRLLDTLLDWLKVSNDKKLSRVLQISHTIIQKMRAGRLPVRAVILYRMAECAGRSIEELRLVLGDRRRKMRLV